MSAEPQKDNKTGEASESEIAFEAEETGEGGEVLPPFSVGKRRNDCQIFTSHGLVLNNPGLTVRALHAENLATHAPDQRKYKR